MINPFHPEDSYYWQLIRPFEGGYVNDPVDAGGETNKGITLNTFYGLAHKVGYEPTYELFINMPDDFVLKVWRYHYDYVSGRWLASSAIGNLLAGWMWGSGISAFGWAKNALNARWPWLNLGSGIQQFSTWEIVRLNMLILIMPNAVYNTISEAREAQVIGYSYTGEQSKFRTGWQRRLDAENKFNKALIFNARMSSLCAALSIFVVTLYFKYNG